ncbi:MAG: hypothetical protein HFE99_10430 [Ruminiclostridium sp.]|nr:hypothetical protein [Ruminiclostridium sp.]
MFLYKSSRLHVGPVSFALPEGFYLDSDTPDGYANALTFYAPDHRFCFHIATEKDPLDSHNSLKSFIGELSKERILRQITPITHPIPGHEVIYTEYKNRARASYEAHFDYYDKGEHYNFILYTTGDAPVDEVMSHPGFQAVFDSIRLDPQTE